MLKAPKVTGNRMRAYLSILLVSELEGGGAGGGGLVATGLADAPKVFAVV